MTNKAIVFVIAGFSILVLGMFGLSYIQKQKSLTDVPPVSPLATSTDPYQISRIEAKHFYRDYIVRVFVFVNLIGLPVCY